MKVLIICPMLPWPLKAGGDQAVFHMINFLQNRVDIHFLCPFPKSVVPEEFKKKWQNVSFHLYQENKNFNFMKSRMAINVQNQFVMDGKGYFWLQSASNFFTPAYLDFVNEVISQAKPDIIQTEFYNYQDLVYALPNDIKKVFIQHEIRFMVNAQRLGKMENKPAFKRFMFEKLKGEEIVAMNKYDAVFTLTEDDKEKLHENGVIAPIYSSPAGIKKPSRRNACTFRNKLIFVGGEGHTPNAEGLNWFLGNVWEKILEHHPQVCLNIVGVWNKQLTKMLVSQYKNISFRGFVPNLQEEYDGAIAVIPILRGSGMRMKIIDAVNYGAPFVSTSIGAEGLEYKDNVDCFIADDPDVFAQKVVELIEDESCRKRFYDNSALTCDKFYSIETLALKRLELYRKVLEGN